VLVPSAAEKSLPAALDDIVVRALARDPADRFASVRELGRALLPFASTETARAWERDFPGPATERLVDEARTDDSDTLIDVPPPAPPLPCEPGSSTCHVKGIAYRGLVRLVERKVPGGLRALDEELGDPRLAVFVRQPFLPASRYDMLPMLPLNVAVARLLGRPLESLAVEQGAVQARYDVRHVYRRFFEAMTLETVAAFIGHYGALYYEAGECTAEPAEPGHLVVHRRRVPTYVLPWFAPLHSSYLEEVVRLKGARAVKATCRPPTEAGNRRGVALVDIDTDVRWQ
jgi:hypothetical protein